MSYTSTPSKRFNAPIIGIITTKRNKIIKTTDNKSETQFLEPVQYEVIEVTDKFYVTNTWYKEYKEIPLVVLKEFIEKFEPI